MLVISLTISKPIVALRGQSFLQPGKSRFFEVNPLLDDVPEPVFNVGHFMQPGEEGRSRGPTQAAKTS